MLRMLPRLAACTPTRLAAAALVLAALVPPAGRVSALPRQATSAAALEDLLRAARLSAEQRSAELRPLVLEQVERIERLKPSQKGEWQSARGELLRLGREVAALLVPYLDAGAKDTPATRQRANLVQSVLTELHSHAALPGLLALAAHGAPAVRVRALAILGTTEDPELVLAPLRAAAADKAPQIRAAAYSALAGLAGDAAAQCVQAGLNDPAPEVLGAVLTALSAAQDTAQAPAIVALLLEPRVRGCAAQALAYFRSHPQLASPLVCQRLLALAGFAEVSLAERQALLAAVPSFQPPWDAALRKALDSVLSGPDPQLRTDALVCLARLGDKSARKELRREQDEYVTRNSSWPQAWASRARLLLRIEEYDAAQRDFKRALELYQEASRNLGEERECQVGLARAYALDKRLKDAAATLEKAGLTPDELRKLGQDPDFAELAAHPKWGKLLSGL
jgi:HEAT repeat protein